MLNMICNMQVVGCCATEFLVKTWNLHQGYTILLPKMLCPRCQGVSMMLLAKAKSFWSVSHVYQMCLIFMAPYFFVFNWRRSTHEIRDAALQLFYFFFLTIFGIVVASSCCLPATATSRWRLCVFFRFFLVSCCFFLTIVLPNIISCQGASL